MGFGKMFFSPACSGCQPDGFLIVLKDSWELRLSLFSLAEMAQFGKQWITQAPRSLVNWKKNVTSSSLSLRWLLVQAFLNASPVSGSVLVAFCVFQGWDTDGRERRCWLKHEDILRDKSFITLKLRLSCDLQRSWFNVTWTSHADARCSS